MPVYHVKDSQTGLELDVRGDRPPTDEELTQIFAERAGQQRARQSVVSDVVQGRRRKLTGGEDDSPTTLDDLNGMLEPMAHPKTPGDFAALLIPAEVPPISRFYASAFAKGKEFADQYGSGVKDIVPETIKELYRRAFPSPIHDSNILMRPSQMGPGEHVERLKYGRPGGYGGSVPADVQAESDRFKSMRDRRVNRPAAAPAERPNIPEFEPTDAKVTEPAGGRSAEAVQAVQEQQYEDLLKKHGGRDTTPPTPSTATPTRAAGRARPQSPATASSRRSRAASPTTPITSFEDITELEKAQAEALHAQGKTPEEILDHLNAMREFRAKFNTMSPEEGERAAARNRTQSRKEHAKKRAEREAGGSDDD